MSGPASATKFLPAEREPEAVILEHSRSLAAERYLIPVLNAVPDPLVILNEKRQVVFANERLLAFANRGDLRQVCGRRPGEILDCVHAGETAGGCGTTEACRYCGAALAILSCQQGRPSGKECRIARGSSETLNLKVNASPVSIGKRTYAVVGMSDISSDKRRAVLEQLLFEGLLEQAKGIRQEAGAAASGDEGALRSFRDTADRLSVRMIGRINEHRILAAAEKGQIKLRPEWVKVHTLLQQVVDFYLGAPEAKGVSVDIGAHSSMKDIRTDPIVFKQVLGYLILNAIEASCEGERVTVRADATPGDIEVVVHNPATLARRDQLRVFQRGFTTRGKGRGLGTYAARLLTERFLGGRVTFSSDDLGTRFVVTLPRDIKQG